MPWIEWYDALLKPSWTPTPSTIRLIWTLLYPLILVSVGVVFVKAFRRTLPRLVALPFAVNLVANLLFMPIFAGLRNVPLAADIVVVWLTILWCVTAVRPNYRWVVVAQVPYFVWVTLATTIQLAIAPRNWGRP